MNEPKTLFCIVSYPFAVKFQKNEKELDFEIMKCLWVNNTGGIRNKILQEWDEEEEEGICEYYFEDSPKSPLVPPGP